MSVFFLETQVYHQMEHGRIPIGQYIQPTGESI